MSSAQLLPNVPEPVTPIPPVSVPEPRKPRSRWIWLLAAAIVIAGAIQWARQGARTSKAKPVLAIRTSKVRVAPLARTIRLTGMTVAEKAAILTAPMMIGNRRSGDYSLTLQTLVPNGSIVKKGDQVAGFDLLHMRLLVDDYDANVIQHERYLKILSAKLDVTRTAHNRKIEQAKAAWEKALLNLKTAPVRSAIQVEKFDLAAKEAKSRYDEYLVQAKYLETSEMAAIRVRELDLRETRLQAKRIRNNMEKMRLKAPIDGLTVIQTTHRGTEHAIIEAGDQLRPGQMLMQIVDIRSLIVNATVNQVEAEELRIGAKAHIHVDAFPDIDLPGHVVSIGAFARMGTYRRSFLSEIPVRIKFDRLDSRIIPNFSVSADIVLDSKESTAVIPRECVFDESGGQKHFAYVRNGDRWERRGIEVGLLSNVTAEVTAGLRTGEEIAAEQVPAEMLAGVSQ